ncbi:acyl carrier protein [Streptomyces pathocidini]|uniref:acyl carrier protein n=1 Tax=Streptomyces pathocidini TaxID=1650571 RepID=UPI0034047E00
MNRDLRILLLDELKLPEAQLTDTTSLEKAGLDSLATVELSVLLQDRLGVTITESEIESAATLHQLDLLVEQKRNGR